MVCSHGSVDVVIQVNRAMIDDCCKCERVTIHRSVRITTTCTIYIIYIYMYILYTYLLCMHIKDQNSVTLFVSFNENYDRLPSGACQQKAQQFVGECSVGILSCI